MTGPEDARAHDHQTPDPYDSGVRAATRSGMARYVPALGAVVMVVVGAILIMVAGSWVNDKAALSRSVNNEKQIGIAFQACHDTYGRLPNSYFQREADLTLPADSSRRLSWRVGLLPFIESTTIYVKFKQDEPWDGPTNGPLGEVAIDSYCNTGRGAKPPNNQTPYRVFVGGGALFDAEKPGKKFSEITSGLSDTILFVEAEQTVPWTQHNELPFDPDGPLPPLGTPGREVFLTGMADGSVRIVKKSVSPQALKAAITASGGGQLPLD
ncbi:DUF1559 domain-containing protein [Fimbriiglobus ruber]|uniref:DUF1559 domain-containing protein n=1 Tax=Fimbriiglobus ruber TaxID=1908690 RepID=A0A225D9K6_9BACT|nr:DUF1559 domain-containing protein [Fimbriiglobus ruber]OWK36344.1 hypothetical protein FRUB_08907 [Fimbriiglobus ruber]